MLEKMAEFFENRLNGYDEHMMTGIEAADEFYPFTASLLPTAKGSRVLDLGCGTGLELEKYFPLCPSANMIGVKKRIIAFLDESGRAPTYAVMLNPEIIKKDGAYDTEEGCLSLLGGPRKCKRYKTIKVQYQNMEMQTRTKNFTGWTAQIIQHEVDHCNGVLI